MRNPENPLAEPIEIDPKTFFPPDAITGDSILIARLHPQWNSSAPPERIQLRARASISTGGENIRWSPVSQASYEYTRDANPDHVEAVYNKWLATAKKIDETTAVDPARQEALRREFETMEIQRCYLMDAKGDPNDFTFHLESVGIQPIPTIMESALASCEALVTKYMDIDGVVPDNVRVQVGDSAFPSIDFVFGKETHTLGNLLETWLIENLVSDMDDAEITYTGYKVPHPLLAEMVIRVGVREGMDVDVRKTTARRAVARACRALKDEFRQLRAAWAGLTATE
jgi:DNA-directed RNA polymerase subunit L